MSLRLTALIVVTALLYAVRCAGLPLRRVSTGAARGWRDLVMGWWAHAVTRLIGLRPIVSGPLPKPPFVLVTNHLGYVDIFLLARYLNGVFVAKADLARWPLAGTIIASMDTIFVDRERKRDVMRVNQCIAQALDAGEGVILFPEGTSSDGATVLPLMPSLLSVPASRETPVWYAGIRYETPTGEAPSGEVVSWWGDDEFVPHLLRLLQVPHFVARLRFAEHPMLGNDRKKLAGELHAGISAQCAIQPT
ncbi:MAG: lysophospholipid acyltransferase family protein [Pseudomonadota bacterium]